MTTTEAAAVPVLPAPEVPLQPKKRRPLSTPTSTVATLDPGVFRMIERNRIEPSPWNPRKEMGDTTELEASIKEKGILQPIVVRLWKGTADRYELVCGERRWTAAGRISLAELPCIVRVLDDRSALECMLIENKDRADVHPLDEAEGFRILVEDFHATEEEVADRVGKSVAHVHRRLRLAKLTDEAKDALRKGTLSAPAALVICQLQDPADQKEAVQALKPQPWEGNQPKSTNEARRVVSSYLRIIKDAPFNPEDAGLVAIAGACGACTKNTTQQRGLFEELDKAARCTDGVCWAQKVKAHSDGELQRLKAKGVEVVASQKAAKEYFNPNSREHLDHRWVDIDSTDYRSNKKYKNILPETVKPTAVLNPETGRVVQVVARTVAEKASSSAGRKAGTGTKTPRSPDQVRWELDTKARRQLGDQLLPKLLEKVEAMDAGAGLRAYLLAQVEAEHSDYGQAAVRRGLMEQPTKGQPDHRKARNLVRDAISKEKDVKKLVGWLVLLNAGETFDTRLRDALAKTVKLDSKGMLASIKKTITAAAREKAKEKSKKKPTPKKTPTKKKR